MTYLTKTKIQDQNEMKKKFKTLAKFATGMGESKKQQSVYTKVKFNKCYKGNNNEIYLWILKPTQLNRGRGIHMFNSLDKLLRILKEYEQGIEEKLPGDKNYKKIEEEIRLVVNNKRLINGNKDKS